MATVTWLYAGGVTATGFNAAAKISASGVSCRLAVSTSPAMSSPVFGSAVSSDAQNYVQLAISGLTANTKYYYAVEAGGTVDTNKVNSLTTFPVVGVASSFTFAHGSCNFGGSNHRVWDAIRGHSPLFLAHLGDWGYSEIVTNDPTLFRAKYDLDLASARQTALLGVTPMVYMYDDHDWGGDDSDGTSVVAPAAQAVYRQCVPSYPLQVSDATYQSFQVGRVGFILTDLRSFRSVDTATDNSSKTMLGATQKTWLKAQLLANKTLPLQFWVSTSVWRTSKPYTSSLGQIGEDLWGSFTTERTEIADYLKANGITNVVILEGDAHMLAYDATGAVSDYATGGGMPIPNFCAAAFDQNGNTREGGGDWPSTCHPGGGQFGLITVTDTGTAVSFTWAGIQVDATTGAETTVMSWPQAHTYTARVLYSVA